MTGDRGVPFPYISCTGYKGFSAESVGCAYSITYLVYYCSLCVLDWLRFALYNAPGSSWCSISSEAIYFS